MRYLSEQRTSLASECTCKGGRAGVVWGTWARVPSSVVNFTPKKTQHDTESHSIEPRGRRGSDVRGLPGTVNVCVCVCMYAWTCVNLCVTAAKRLSGAREGGGGYPKVLVEFSSRRVGNDTVPPHRHLRGYEVLSLSPCSSPAVSPPQITAPTSVIKVALLSRRRPESLTTDTTPPYGPSCVCVCVCV